MFARIKKRLPGPKASAFWLSAAGLVSVYKYNKSQSDQRLQYYCQRAAHAANETIGSLDTPRKVHVYIAVPMGELGTRKARQHWERYILPVFAAGALDYELTLVNDTATESNGVERVVRGGVHRMVAEEIRERRRRRLEAEEENGELRLWRAAIDERKRENEARALKNRLGVEPGMSVLELWKAQEYPGVMDVVAIGRETWVEAVNGISEGASGSLNLQVPELVALDSEQNKKLNTEQNAELNTEPNAEQNTEQGTAHEAGSLADNAGEPAHVVNYDRFDDGAAVALPAVAYIAHANLTGWGAVPLRIRNFFHDQQNVDEYACQALQVVYESTRRAARGAGELEAMGRAEEQMKGWEGQEPLEVVVDPQVAARLQIYDTQNDTAPFKD
ncbi:mitochondrial import inner membrane translocase subunit tim54 [Coemansia sp. RSA 2611]|nr:mitochondrial import inner membrane translocase subunit tim54 [Coemansia sp. RSA 2610]KAJ2375570.1 mitochondrial import inner membrane translocase subunit tim54 [Coemansia sp. RSA 2611]